MVGFCEQRFFIGRSFTIGFLQVRLVFRANKNAKATSNYFTGYIINSSASNTKILVTFLIQNVASISDIIQSVDSKHISSFPEVSIGSDHVSQLGQSTNN
jgi:hypothetical protein